MKYVSVTSPTSEMSKPIFNHFDDYLISLGEPTNSSSWSLATLEKHMNHMLDNKPPESNLYIDSGGFQIIIGKIKSDSDIERYIKIFHILLIKYRERINRIFSLDIYNARFNEPGQEDLLYKFNQMSTQASIDSIKKYPEISDKLLYILQSSSPKAFETWKKIFVEEQVYKYFKLWSIGGLVGLKKSTNAKHSHAVPATLWLLTYIKKYGGQIDQVHWLGQSSRLSFLSMALFERIYGLNMTSDSSQLVRFAPLSHKLPYMYKNEEKGFHLLTTEQEVLDHMIGNHSCEDIKHFSLEKTTTDENANVIHEYLTPEDYYKEYNRLHNTDFIEVQSQNIYYEIEFCDSIVDQIMEIGLYNIDSVTQLEELHPIMSRGRTAKELYNNITFFKTFKDIVENGDVDAADEIIRKLTLSYVSYANSNTIRLKKVELENALSQKLEIISREIISKQKLIIKIHQILYGIQSHRDFTNSEMYDQNIELAEQEILNYYPEHLKKIKDIDEKSMAAEKNYLNCKQKISKYEMFIKMGDISEQEKAELNDCKKIILKLEEEYKRTSEEYLAMSLPYEIYFNIDNTIKHYKEEVQEIESQLRQLNLDSEESKKHLEQSMFIFE